jgi:hypothetical protein
MQVNEETLPLIVDTATKVFRELEAAAVAADPSSQWWRVQELGLENLLLDEQSGGYGLPGS